VKGLLRDEFNIPLLTARIVAPRDQDENEVRFNNNRMSQGKVTICNEACYVAEFVCTVTHSIHSSNGLVVSVICR
jgi:hypothetical protein